jgi:hypothetical protein
VPMKKISVLSALFLVFVSGYAQDTSELNRRNGFKDIKLGSSIDSIKGATLKKEFKEKNEFEAKLYEVNHSDYKNIGEVEVKNLQLMTYKDLVYKIIVSTPKDPRVMKALEKSYGKATYVVRTTSYNWAAEKLSLTFRANRNKIDLIYRSYPVLRKMAEDKGKKIEEIAEDF